MSCVTIYDMPPWLRFNKYILTGYRPAFQTVGQTFATLFSWHNESINVWSHLLPALSLVYLMIIADALVPGSLLFLICIGSCFVVLAASSVYHLFMPCCVSTQGYARLVNCDVLSCLLSITTTAMSFIGVGNRCIDAWTVGTAAAVMLLSAAVVVYMITSATLSVTGRVKVFGGHCLLRLSMAVCFLWPKVVAQGFTLSFYYHVMSFFVLTGGGFINGLRVPERWFPNLRWMDYALNSHNIWHYLCVIALMASLLGCYYDHMEYAETVCFFE